MTPLVPNMNIAARMGRWSARHRKTAIFGWLAFVAVAFVLGNAIGMQKLDDDDIGIGESGRAQEIIDAAGFRDADEETVIVQSTTATATAKDAEFRAVVRDVVERVSALEGARGRAERPLASRP